MGAIQNAVLGIASDAAHLAKWTTEKKIQQSRNEAQKKYFDLISEEKLKQEQQKAAFKEAEQKQKLEYQEKANKQKLKQQRAIDKLKLNERKEKAAALNTRTAALGNGRAMLQTDMQDIQKAALEERLKMLHESMKG